jgi:colicin import membrane protein
MTLHKKCLVASAVTHGLLLVLVLIGSAFIPAKPKEDVISIEMLDPNTILVDEPNVYSGGNPNAVPPPPTAQPKAQAPAAQPAAVPQPQPARTEPKPEPKPVEPVKEPVKEPPPKTPEKEVVKEPARELEKVEPKKPKIDPDSFKILEKSVHKGAEKAPEKPAKATPNFDLGQAQKRVIKPSANTETTSANENAAAEREAQAAKARAGALSSAMSRLQGGLSKGVGEIGIPGPGGQAYASYGLVLRKIYENAWIPPNAGRGDEPVVSVEVVIRKDGTVLSRRITKKSGRTELDKTVQRALDRVNKVPAFPSGSTDEQRTFTIDFNLTDKLSLG